MLPSGTYVQMIKNLMDMHSNFTGNVLRLKQLKTPDTQHAANVYGIAATHVANALDGDAPLATALIAIESFVTEHVGVYFGFRRSAVDIAYADAIFSVTTRLMEFEQSYKGYLRFARGAGLITPGLLIEDATAIIINTDQRRDARVWYYNAVENRLGNEHRDIVMRNRFAVVNATRPISGSYTWEDESGNGRGHFYAAGFVEEHGQHWKDYDAWRVYQITSAQIEAAISAHIEKIGLGDDAYTRSLPVEQIADDYDLPYVAAV